MCDNTSIIVQDKVDKPSPRDALRPRIRRKNDLEYCSSELRFNAESIEGVVTALMEWSVQCKQKAALHCMHAKALRFVHHILNVLGIICAVISAIMSSLVASGIMNKYITTYAAITSGLGVGTQTILSTTNPSWMGITHGNAKLEYELLSRDIDIFLKTETSPAFEDWRIDASRFQRRLDNIQTGAPPL